MGSATSYICRTCGTHFMARDGGGFMFDLLHCDTCGATKSVSHQELGDIHLGFVKGLPGPYAMARAAMDRRIQDEYPGQDAHAGRVPRGGRGDAQVCACGGRFRYDAPARCPGCRSTEDQWDEDPDGARMFID